MIARLTGDLRGANRECEVRQERELGYLARAEAAEADVERLRADAERYRVARRKVCIVGDSFHVINLRPTYVAPDAAIEFDAAIDAARGES